MPAPPPPPTGLPAEDAVPAVAAALADPGVAVLVAPPGAGKTTVVPLRLLTAPWRAGRHIVVLEPRRLAARAAARRMADLLGEPVGRTVGYRTRDERVGGRDVAIEVITEGILVRRLQADAELADTGLVILDEVHERNLTTDLSLALVLDARHGLRPDLRVLAMSATVDADRLAAVLGGTGPPAPVVTSDGRQHPVERRWRPPPARTRLDDHLPRVVTEALADEPAGDVLTFLPGAAEIGRAAAALGGLTRTGVDVYPLHGALPRADQDRALAPSPDGRRRVVLATDIAESSLTVPGVRLVVDAGLARGPRFDPGRGLTRLTTEPASQAAADQRAGRAGRLGPGVAYRLWSEADHLRRPPFPPPEITVVDLAGFALELAVWGARPDQLALPDPPPLRAWEEAVALLGLLDAVDEAGRPTATGKQLAALPLHPRLAHLAVTGRAAGTGWTAALLAAVLDERDVLGGRRDERPGDLAERVALAAGDRRRADASRPAVAVVQGRARELARRLDVARGPVDLTALGPLVAAAYPDRIAQARGGGRFRLRGGGGGWLPDTDPLAAAPYLAVADLDVGVGDGRIRTAAPLDQADVDRLLGAARTVDDELTWDPKRDDLRRRITERADAIVLARRDARPEPGPATAAALVDRVRATAGTVLRWTDGTRALQARLGYLRTLDADRWPPVDDATLLATLDHWLAPHLVAATGRRDLERVDLAAVLRAGLGWADGQALDQLAPTRVVLANGRSLTVDYRDADRGPAAAARVQDLFGLTDHPTVGGGRTPVVLTLLSPAGRPIQVTADLPGFWTGSWRDVRKEMAGRYPKHPWPDDPAAARPPVRRPR